MGNINSITSLSTDMTNMKYVLTTLHSMQKNLHKNVYDTDLKLGEMINLVEQIILKCTEEERLKKEKVEIDKARTTRLVAEVLLSDLKLWKSRGQEHIRHYSDVNAQMNWLMTRLEEANDGNVEEMKRTLGTSGVTVPRRKQ